MAQCSLNNPTYFLPMRQKTKTLLIYVQGRLKANKGQRRSTIHNTLQHHTPQYVMLLF